MRYFIEVGYDGLQYAGFQIQNNAITIQQLIENALLVVTKEKISLTGSSRTDAGVNAYQNYFHFDSNILFTQKHLYSLNAILPYDVVVHSIRQVNDDAHSRFNATSRQYQYKITNLKNPFYFKKAYYLPVPLKMDLLNQVATIYLQNTNFKNFSKTNAQVHTYECTILQANWQLQNDIITFNVEGNRFLRGMVKALVGTALQVSFGKYTINDVVNLCTMEKPPKPAIFTPPGYALYLQKVNFPSNIFM
jgi:tRNA pseudouridine38-40 synthase